MMKKSTQILAGLLALALATPAAAQRMLLRPYNPLQAIPKLSPAEKAARARQFKADYPLLAQRKELNAPQEGLIEVRPVVPFRNVAMAAGSNTAGSVSTFWPFVHNYQGWPYGTNGRKKTMSGVYAFTPAGSSPFALDSLVINNSMRSYGGAAIVNGIYYKFYANTLYMDEGYVTANLYSYDITTWEPTAESGVDMNDHLDLFATEVAQAADGTVYGQFFTSDLSSLEYGVADYVNKTRTTIGPSTNTMLALGVTNDNKLYGIASDGNLYKINTSTGTETLVGATGLSLLDSEGYYYSQTGEIDPKTNVFYWYAIDGDGNDGLYTVDLSTGAATLVGQFEGGAAELYDMIVAGKVSEDSAPAIATNVAATFAGGSTSGTVSFTAPTRDYADANVLTGTLNYAVTVNKDTVAAGTCAPGEDVSADVSAPEGLNKFVVTTSNAVGVSPRASVSCYVGYDTPKAPAAVKVNWADDNTSATITWDAVTQGLHAGYLGNITYKVVRLLGKDSTVVAEATTATTVTDSSLPADGPMKCVKYLVSAGNGEKTSPWTTSDGRAIGSPFEVPYLEEFSDEDAASLYTIIDANKDGKTWYWFGSRKDPFMRIYYSSTKNMDDWLITPPINFKGGSEYTLTFKSFGSQGYPEKLEVKYGSANTVEGMTNVIAPVTVMQSGVDTVFHLTFTPEADGVYYVGFHGCSNKDMNWSKIDSIYIHTGVLPTSPDAPDITVAPAAKGALTATITVKAPAKAANGDALTADHLSKVLLRRGSTDIHTFEAPAPGTTVIYEDTVAADGNYKYIAIPYDGNEAGEQAEASAYIGLDKPKNVENAKALDKGTAVHLTWDAVSEVGVNGGYVDPATLKTIVYDVDNQGYITNSLDTLTNATSYDVDYNTNEGAPDLKQWALKNENRTGASSAQTVVLPVGKPYTLPFLESTAGGRLTHDWWIHRDGGTTTSNRWAYTSSDAADGDGGSFIYKSTADNVNASMNSYKIDLGSAVNPTLVFSYNVKNTEASTSGTLKVEVQTLDGADHAVYESPALTADQPWNQHIISLKSFAGKVVLLKFHALCQNAPLTIGVDKIRVQDACSHDLSAVLTAPDKVIKGQAVNATVKVTNEGLTKENAYTVKLFADGTEVNSMDVTNELDAFFDTTLAVSVPTSSLPTDKTEKVLKAKVVLDGDLLTENDESTAAVAMIKSELPSPENLAATEDHPHILLTWNTPDISSAPVTDDFESYSPWAVGETGALSSVLGGGWTTIDGQADQYPTVFIGQLWQNILYPGQGRPASFVIFNADSVSQGSFDANTFFQGHDGSHQFAAMIYEANGTDFVDGDNYLVSPPMTGEAQTVTFYARNALAFGYDNPESFEFLYSTTGNAKDDFTHVVIPDTTLTGGEWQYFEAAIPDSATYFTIHQTSSASGTGDYLFSVDDVTFLKGVAAPVGYNVYCDGELVGHVGADGTLEFSGDAPDGTHQWSVTAVYPDGQESEPVSVTATSDISSVVADGEPFDVFTLDGILVRSRVKDVKDLKTGVYIINDKKVIIK